MPKVLSKGGEYARIVLRGENMPNILPRGKVCQLYSKGGVYAKTAFQGGENAKTLF